MKYILFAFLFVSMSANAFVPRTDLLSRDITIYPHKQMMIFENKNGQMFKLIPSCSLAKLAPGNRHNVKISTRKIRPGTNFRIETEVESFKKPYATKCSVVAVNAIHG